MVPLLFSPFSFGNESDSHTYRNAKVADGSSCYRDLYLGFPSWTSQVSWLMLIAMEGPTYVWHWTGKSPFSWPQVLVTSWIGPCKFLDIIGPVIFHGLLSVLIFSFKLLTLAYSYGIFFLVVSHSRANQICPCSDFQDGLVMMPPALTGGHQEEDPF